MKKSMLITLALLAFAMGSSFAATTIVVTITGTPTTYTDMLSASNAMVPGATMDIQDFDGPMLWGGANGVSGNKTCPSWCTVGCSKPGAQATILIPLGNGGNNSFGSFDHLTLINLSIDGQCTSASIHGSGATATCACILNGGDFSSATNCSFKGAWWNEIYIDNGAVNSGIQDAGTTFTDCYFESPGCCIAFTDSWVTAPATDTDKTVINHCTLVADGGGQAMNVDSSFDGTDIKSVYSIHNSIISARQGAVGIVYPGASPPADTTQYVDEDYNMFDCFWNQIYSQGGGVSGPPVGTHSIVFDFRKMAGGSVPTTPPALDFFRDFAHGDYRLALWSVNNINPCIRGGSDGMNIGADITSTPVELSTFSVE
jgi:hypothetical protein